VTFFRLILVASTLGIGVLCAEIIPVASIRDLVNSADLIVVGRVERVEKTGQGSKELQGRTYPGKSFLAELRVDETIKGEPLPAAFTLHYSTPSTDAVGNVAEGGLASNTYRVVLLKKTDTGYEFVSPYYPSLPACPKSCATDWHVDLGDDAYHRVLQRVLDVLCASSDTNEKKLALWALNWDEDSSAAPFLKAALAHPEIRADPVLSSDLVSYLLRWKDLSVLPLAENAIFQPSQHTDGNSKSNLLLAISKLNPELSVPLLTRALKLPEPEARIAAARFLQYTESETALDGLLSALDDPNREVQFAVMQSLGNLTEQYQWRPSSTEPDAFWFSCIQHWREFEAARKAAVREQKL